MKKIEGNRDGVPCWDGDATTFTEYYDELACLWEQSVPYHKRYLSAPKLIIELTNTARRFVMAKEPDSVSYDGGVQVLLNHLRSSLGLPQMSEMSDFLPSFPPVRSFLPWLARIYFYFCSFFLSFFSFFISLFLSFFRSFCLSVFLSFFLFFVSFFPCFSLSVFLSFFLSFSAFSFLSFPDFVLFLIHGFCLNFVIVSLCFLMFSGFCFFDPYFFFILICFFWILFLIPLPIKLPLYMVVPFGIFSIYECWFWPMTPDPFPIHRRACNPLRPASRRRARSSSAWVRSSVEQTASSWDWKCTIPFLGAYMCRWLAC